MRSQSYKSWINEFSFNEQYLHFGWICTYNKFCYLQHKKEFIDKGGGGGGGGNQNFVESLADTSQGMIQMFSKFLTFFRMMLGPGWKSHFEHIFNDCPENGPSLTKIYKCFRWKSPNYFFFKIWWRKFQFNVKSLMFWVFFAQKLTNL